MAMQTLLEENFIIETLMNQSRTTKTLKDHSFSLETLMNQLFISQAPMNRGLIIVTLHMGKTLALFNRSYTWMCLETSPLQMPRLGQPLH